MTSVYLRRSVRLSLSFGSSAGNKGLQSSPYITIGSICSNKTISSIFVDLNPISFITLLCPRFYVTSLTLYARFLTYCLTASCRAAIYWTLIESHLSLYVYYLTISYYVVTIRAVLLNRWLVHIRSQTNIRYQVANHSFIVRLYIILVS